MKPTAQHKVFNPDKGILWLVGIITVLKLLLIPFAQTVDADAVSRTFLAEDWLNNPIWISKGVWGPFHFYLGGCILAIWNNPVYAPILLNCILSVITLLPFYFFVKREFNANGAFVASSFLAISPIIFRNSLMNMSEPPYLLLLALTLNFLSKGFKSKHAADFLLAGLSITIASGFRFEAWFFILLFTGVILLKKEKINAVWFFIIAMIYPASVIITHFVQDHYSLSGFFTNYPWSLHPNGYFAPPKLEDYLRRLWFIPFCWFVSLGPPVAYITIKEIVQPEIKNAGTAWCALVFWAFFILTEISAFKGSIILETRFSATVTLLSLPFCAFYFKELTNQKIRLAILFGALTIGLTFVYNMQNITPVPRLANQNGNKVAEIVKKNISPESGLIIDFWEWENPGYIGLQSKLPSHSVYILSGDDKDKVQSKEINEIIQNHRQGIILLVRNSVLWQNAIISDKNLRFKFSNTSLNIQAIYSDNEIEAWKYSK